MFKLNSFKTVGAFVLYKDTLAFMIGPDHTGKQLGIVRCGGHIEENENIYDALKREMQEEASIGINLINSPKVYHKESWGEKEYCETDTEGIFDINPLVIVGNEPSTAVFLSYAEQEPKPFSEACGIIFLKEKDIIDICSGQMTLREFINSGGKIIQQKEINYDLEMRAGVHLKFLFDLMKDKDEIICKYLKGDMNIKEKYKSIK